MADSQYPASSAYETADLGYARVDLGREERTGDPEVVFAEGKTPPQIAAILRRLQVAHPHRAVLATRLSPDAIEHLRRELPEADIDDVARCCLLGPLPEPRGLVTVIAAGTSDLSVAREAATTAAVYGAEVEEINDVGVAGLHRLMAVRDRIDASDCLIVVAGMEGALPSVVGGLTGVPLVAVPTSVGYGASFGGIAALLAMLNSCAPGVTVVNIDNGFGAGVFAARVARQSTRSETARHDPLRADPPSPDQTRMTVDSGRPGPYPPNRRTDEATPWTGHQQSSPAWNAGVDTAGAGRQPTPPPTSPYQFGNGQFGYGQGPTSSDFDISGRAGDAYRQGGGSGGAAATS
jgi:NCAIR mutase (PurE)-related protein